MLVSVQNWCRPENIEEALQVLKKGEVIPYAGGTSFHRGGKIPVTRFVDLRKLGLHYINETDEYIAIGACTRFSDIANYSLNTSFTSLKEACSIAASPSLRNLITIGGSLASKPAWSNIQSPLLALDAKIEIAGENQGEYRVEDFLKNRLLTGRSLITKVSIPKTTGRSAYLRYSRTAFAYSTADTAVYVNTENEVIKLIRIAVGNLRSTAKRLHQIENDLTGMKLNDGIINDLSKDLEDILKSVYSKVIDFKINIAKTLIMKSLKKLCR